MRVVLESLFYSPQISDFSIKFLNVMYYHHVCRFVTLCIQIMSTRWSVLWEPYLSGGTIKVFDLG